MNSNFDIVFSHVMSPIFSIAYVGRYCKRFKIPHFHYCFDLWPESLIAAGYLKRRSFLFQLMKKYCTKIYYNCNMITFASPSCENYFRNYLKIDNCYKHIYQPCLSIPPKRASKEIDEYRLDNVIHILFCGTIARFNHLDLFLNAISSSSYKDSIHFDIVGSGADEEKLKGIVDQLGISNNELFHSMEYDREKLHYY